MTRSFRRELADAIGDLMAACFFAGRDDVLDRCGDGPEVWRVQQLIDHIPASVMRPDLPDDVLLPGERDRLLAVMRRMRGDD